MPNEIDELEDIEDDLPLNEDEPGLENEENEEGGEHDDDESPNAPVLTPQQIAELAARTAAGMNQPQQQQRQLSPEELDAKLNRYKVNVELVKLLRDPEAKPEDVAAKLQELVDGSAKFATTSSQLLFENALGPIQQQIEAQKAYVREQQTKNFVKHVETRFPALQGKGKLVRQALEHVVASGYTPPNGSKSAAQKQVALVAEQIIRSVDPTFRLKSVQNQQRQAGSFGTRRAGGGGSSNVSGKTGAASFLDYLG